jgi:putative toxin-antitoxin system antitoxin component (TIGR02293 family)
MAGKSQSQHPYAAASEFLGAAPLAARQAASSYDLGQAIERGLPHSALLKLKQSLGLTDASLAKLIGVSARTLSRLRVKPRLASAKAAPDPVALLDPIVSDRLFRYANLFVRARDLLGTEDAARDWLTTMQRGLGGLVPLDAAATEPGAREVEALLHRIEHGVYS